MTVYLSGRGATPPSTHRGDIMKDKEKDQLEWLRILRIVEGWFADEEVEVTDFVLGRMTSRIKDLLDAARINARR